MSSSIDFYQISLKLLLKNSEGKILALKGHPKGSYSGYYDLPGRRINEDEFNTPYEELLKREVHEELGNIQLTMQSAPIAIGRHNVPNTNKQNPYGKDIHIFYVFFMAEYLGGEITISDEHNGYDWLKISSQNDSEYFKSGLLEEMRMSHLY